MAINGAWRATNGGNGYASAGIWGTGVNSVHSKPGPGSRNISPGYGPNDGHIPENLVGETGDGYTTEDMAFSFFGDNAETGLRDRPGLGERNARATTTAGYPAPGQHVAGLPGGTQIRSREHGGRLNWLSKLRTQRPIVEDFVNKEHRNTPEDSDGAAMSQLTVQTSMAQRDLTRRGSTRSGTASEYNAPIRRAFPGMKIQETADGERHYDMRPRTQSPGLRRPMYTRQAGAGDPRLMQVNAAYESIPRTRTAPEQPFTGADGSEMVAPGYAGYTTEDPLW